MAISTRPTLSSLPTKPFFLTKAALPRINEGEVQGEKWSTAMDAMSRCGHGMKMATTYLGLIARRLMLIIWSEDQVGRCVNPKPKQERWQ